MTKYKCPDCGSELVATNFWVPNPFEVIVSESSRLPVVKLEGSQLKRRAEPQLQLGPGTLLPGPKGFVRVFQCPTCVSNGQNHKVFVLQFKCRAFKPKTSGG